MSAILSRNAAFFLILCLAPSAFASTGGIDTPEGILQLPLAVQGTPGVILTAPAGSEVGTVPDMDVKGNALFEGKVGIGSSAPQGNLDIQGTACLNGSCIDKWSGANAQTGTVSYSDGDTTGYYAVKHVTFPKAYSSAPIVFVTTQQWHSDTRCSKQWTHFETTAHNITATGFDLQVFYDLDGCNTQRTYVASWLSIAK